MQRQRRFRRGAAPPSTAALSLLGKELREAHLQSLIGNSSRINSLITNAPDPLLSTSVYTVPIMETIESTSKPSPSVEETPSNPPPLSQQPPKPMWVPIYPPPKFPLHNWIWNRKWCLACGGRVWSLGQCGKLVTPQTLSFECWIRFKKLSRLLNNCKSCKSSFKF